MVIPDADARAPQIAPAPIEAPRPRLAPPLHRLAAVIVDTCVVLAPVYLVLSAPVKRAMTVNVFVGATDPAYYSLVMFGIAFVLGVGYQTLMHWRFGATFGKRLFGLEVRSISGPATFGMHLVRSLGWVGSVLFAGVPFFAVWSHARRRPLHDRLAETEVVAHANGVGAPVDFARGLVRAAYGLVAVAMTIVLAYGMLDLRTRAREEERSASVEGACDVVSRYAADDDEDEHARVHLAMTLFAAGLADRSCLESEVERESAMGTAFAPSTYLAQAFVNADDAEVSNAYLDKVCEDAPESAECSMSELVSHWSNEDWDGVETELARAPTGSGYLEVWGVRHFLRRANFARALAGLDDLIDRPELADFTVEARVRALYGDARVPEAREAFKQAITVLPSEGARELSAWSCVQEFARGCSAVTQTACARVASFKRSEDESSAVALAHLRTNECRADAEIDYLELADRAATEDWDAFYRGSAKIAGADRAGARALLDRVIDSESADDLLRVEAIRRLAMVSSNQELRDLVNRWNRFDSRVVRALARPVLAERLAARGDRELEAQVERDAGPVSPRAPANAEHE